MIIKPVKDPDSFFNFKGISDLLNLLVKGWFNRGKTIEVTLAVGANRVQHRLKRRVTKVILVWANAATTLYHVNDVESPDNYVSVVSSAAATVTLYVD